MVHISQCKLVTLQTVYITTSPGAFDSEKRLQSEEGSFRLSKLSLPSWRLSSDLALSPLKSTIRGLCDESGVVSLWQGHKTSSHPKPFPGEGNQIFELTATIEHHYHKLSRWQWGQHGDKRSI